jgi:hypothetical protein
MRAPNAANALIYYEAGQEYTAMAALTDSGDHTTYTSPDDYWSGYDGREPVVRPDGILTGGAMTPAATGTSNYVDVAAITCYLAGVATSVSAGADNDCPRSDATYLVLTLAASGYTDCVAGDIGKTVTGTVTGDSGELIAYNNTTREWLIDQDAPEDTFDDDDEGLTIGTGTGAGDLSAIGAAAPYRIHSLTVNSSGALAVVSGYEGSSFSTTRGVPGGAPFIPVGSIEIGQVRYTSGTGAAVTAAEIFQTEGTHKEMSDFPVWEEDWLNGEITMSAAIPAIHTGSTTKKVYAAYYTPVFAEVANGSDFVPAETTHSVSSTQIYGGTIGARSSSLGQGSFACRLPRAGVGDGLVKMKNKNLWFKFHPDRYKDSHLMTQGVLGIARTYPAGDSIVINCTISPEAATDEVEA